MSNARTDIRTNAASTLVAAAIVGSNVFQGRGNILDPANFPAIYLYAVRESIETQTIRPTGRTQYRKLDLMVDYYAAQTVTTVVIDNQFDTASALIESAIEANPTLNGAAGDTLLTNVEYVIDDEERLWGCARHSFSVIYTTKI
jgi:hypothetical protein